MIRTFFNSSSLQAIFRKSQFTIFAITFFICTLTFTSVSVLTVESYAQQNLLLVSRTVSERIQPALVFQDKITLTEIISEYTQQHAVKLIQVYDHSGHQITQSTKDTEYYSTLQNVFDRIFLNDPVQMNVMHNGQNVGKVILYGSSKEILIFVFKIFIGLLLGMLFMVFALWWSVNSTYHHIMKSISPITQIAQLVSNQKAYNLRFPDNDIKEFDHLISVFNQLLEEIQSWHNHLQNENSLLAHQVQHDDLTQLPNRNYFHQVLQQKFDNPTQRKTTAVIFIDNNNFKSINDKYGHLAGDEVLKETAKRLKANIRQTDFVARLSGDEFAIILDSVYQTDYLISIAENLIKSCEEPILYNDQEIHFSFSLGIALAINSHSVTDVLSQADEAMYKAKNLKNHWFIYHN